MLLIILVWIALAIVVGFMARSRGRNGLGWTILACLISPPVAGIFLKRIPNRSPLASQPLLSEHVDCLHCGQRILREARVCRHCGGDVTQAGLAAVRQAMPVGYWFDLPDPAFKLIRTADRVALVKPVAPWIVVDESLDSIVIGSRWPGKLWRVRVEKQGDMSDLVAQPGYWRASAIELLEELPLSALFGPKGEAVLEIIAKINTLTRSQAQAQALADHVPENAWLAYSRAWMNWSHEDGDPVSVDESDWRGTLAASRRGDKARAPIHSGFLLIHSQLRQRAQQLDGGGAFVLVEEDGETEQVLSPLWQRACDALLFAAMAHGAPQYVAGGDAVTLTQAWTRAFGGPGQRA
jgi:ribosomal protein L40E